MDALINQIKHNLEHVGQNITRAAKVSGRQPHEIRLVVVSKTQPTETIRAAYQAGMRCFGENYPQEAELKINQLAHLAGIEWHMIGHLQSRKAPIIANCFHMIHSIDSLSLAVKLDRILEEKGKMLPALLEVNVGGEMSKYGWDASNEADWANLIVDFGKIADLPHLKIQGLMTMPPLFDNPELSRPFFIRLNRLRDFLAARIPSVNWTELSMGTSSDYVVAIEEGASIIRVGQAILGPRSARQNDNQGEHR